MKLQIGLTVLMVAGTVQAQSLWQPPSTPDRDERPQVTHAEGSAIRITSIKVAGYPVALERTPLEDAQAHLGGVVGHQGEAGDGMVWLCYFQTERQLQASAPWMIWLEERGDLYNPPLVSGFQWRTVPAHSVPDERCKSLPVPIRLGQSRAAIRDLMGSPTAEYPQALVYSASHPKEIKGTSSAYPFTEIETIAISFENGKVAAIDVYKSTTG